MSYTISSIQHIVDAQRTFFRTGTTLDVNWRLRQLHRSRNAVIANEKEFEEALYADLGRSATEAYLCDIGQVVVEINEMLRGLRRWARPEDSFFQTMQRRSDMYKYQRSVRSFDGERRTFRRRRPFREKRNLPLLRLLEK